MHASPLPYPHLHQTHTILYIKSKWPLQKNLPAQTKWGLFLKMQFLGYYEEIQDLLNTFKFKIELNFRFYESAKQLVRCV